MLFLLGEVEIIISGRNKWGRLPPLSRRRGVHRWPRTGVAKRAQATNHAHAPRLLAHAPRPLALKRPRARERGSARACISKRGEGGVCKQGEGSRLSSRLQAAVAGGALCGCVHVPCLSFICLFWLHRSVESFRGCFSVVEVQCLVNWLVWVFVMCLWRCSAPPLSPRRKRTSESNDGTLASLWNVPHRLTHGQLRARVQELEGLANQGWASRYGQTSAPKWVAQFTRSSPVPSRLTGRRPSLLDELQAEALRQPRLVPPREHATFCPSQSPRV